MEEETKKREAAVRRLIDKAASADKSEDALRFSQSACNVANAIYTVKTCLGPISEV